MSTAYVYVGSGAGQRSVASTIGSLANSLNLKVESLGTAELLEGKWIESCVVLCLPGGADLPYCRALNGKGNAIIRDYVEGGGAYLGLCAGAYYACDYIEFEMGTPLEVSGERELKFFPGLAKGAVYPGFTYETEAGTVAAPIAFKVRKGVAVLCGTHPELDSRWLDSACSGRSIKKAHPEYSDIRIAQLVDRAKEVRRCLHEDHDLREKFWLMLLSEANLCQYLKPAKKL